MPSKTFNSDHVWKVMNELNRERKLSSQNCDIIFSTTSYDFAAHKCIVAAVSKFCEKMCTNEMREKYEKRIKVEGVSEETMESILEFIYLCKITITDENVYSVMEAADYLEIQNLKDYCLKFFCDHLNLQNFIKIQAYAKRYKYKKLVTKANRTIAEEFERLVNSDDFNALSLDELLRILQLENKQVSSEEVICRAVLGWVKHDIAQRRQHLKRVFEMIKLENLDANFLQNIAATEEMVKNSHECTARILTFILPRLVSFENQQGVVSLKDVNQKLLAIKGEEVFCYDVTNKKLQKMKNMTFDHEDGSAVSFNNDVYVIGGEVADSSVERLNTEDMTSNWVMMGSTNEERWDSASSVCGDYIYTVGGWIGGSPSSSGEVYNHRDNKWSFINNMNEKRGGHSLVCVKDKLFVVGGWNGSKRLDSMECYNPVTGDWSILSNMTKRRFAAAAVALNEEIFVIGGFDDENELSSVEKFTPLTESWKEVAPLSRPRWGHSACVVNGKICIAGGTESGTVEFYDPRMNAWEVEATFEELEHIDCIVSI